jgi:multidrug efflux pump subunit AcrB
MSSFDQANIPDLEEFSRRVEEAAAAAKQFANSSGQQQPSGDTVNTKISNESSSDSGMSKDILSALSAIHDEATAIKDLLNKMMGS